MDRGEAFDNRVRISRRHFLHVSVGGGGLLLLTACAQPTPPTSNNSAPSATGGSTAASAQSTSAPAAPAATAPAAQAAPTARSAAAPSGSIAIGLPSEPATLDPMFAPGTQEYVVIVNVMEGLFTTGESLKVVPVLAESYQQLDDVDWEFKLKKGITFHNGEPFNAASVKATYDWNLDSAHKVRNTWGDDVNLDRVDVVDDYTVRFHTSTPTPHMLARLANDHYMFPPKYLAETDPKAIARKPVGTGPYVFKDWSTGEQITLEANPKYWGPTQPRIKTATWKWVQEDTSRVANLKTGAWDMITTLAPTAIPDIKADPKLQVIAIPGGRRVYVGFNTKLKPVDDLRVRQAINYGTDIESITSKIFAGATHRMTNWVNAPFENPDVKGYHYDPAKAKELLSQAGYPNGFELTFDVDNGNYMMLSEFPQAIATSLRDIGVNVKLNTIDGAVMRTLQKNRTTHEMYLRSTAPFFDPGLEFQLLQLTHAGNGTQWDDPEFQGLLKQLWSGGTPDQRLQWSYQAQARLMDQAPMLFLWKQPEIYGAKASVKGFSPNGDERIRLLEMSLSA